MFKHKIGIHYNSIIKTRKSKRELPYVARLKKTVDIEKLINFVNNQLNTVMDANAAAAFPELVTDPKDLEDTERNYNLNKSDGSNFVGSYDEVYDHYASIGYHGMTNEAFELGKTCKHLTKTTPVERARGMRLTDSKSYHPYYDERNYTKPTEYCTGYIEEILNTFTDEPCRTGLVCLHPKKFIGQHFDIGPEFITRLQIPIITNKLAIIGFKDNDKWNIYHLPADGSIYFINAGWQHYVVNNGNTSRYQIRVCLNGQNELKDMVKINPDYMITDDEFKQTPESGLKHIEYEKYISQKGMY